MDDTITTQHALQVSTPSVGAWRRILLGAPTAWLVAMAACVALVLVALARPATPERVEPASRVLGQRAPASEIEHAFSGITPFTVQRNMGASGGKDATCSIYSDGNLDTGARVTWAVTLCTIHAIGSTSPSG
jgi:membrane protein implicated in regulation of membrane protease activity